MAPKPAPHIAATENPLLEEWTAPFGVPPFDRIEAKHFEPAFAQAFAAHAAEVAAIAANPEPPSFANTIDALESSGDALVRVGHVFHLLADAESSDAIRAAERVLAPAQARHWTRILLDEALFRRIDALHRRRDRLSLAAEQGRVLERYHTMFRRAGA